MNDNSDFAFAWAAAEMGCQNGLTKRELFAAMAMQGLLAVGNRDAFVVVASEAVHCADALLAALAVPSNAKEPDHD